MFSFVPSCSVVLQRSSTIVKSADFLGLVVKVCSLLLALLSVVPHVWSFAARRRAKRSPCLGGTKKLQT
jgi:hypothetical protein